MADEIIFDPDTGQLKAAFALRDKVFIDEQL
ncbi:MAG: hypothetical protein ACI9MR_004600, partial [Myxococcota bacterium]